jgi:hypothetical protein
MEATVLWTRGVEDMTDTRTRNMSFQRPDSPSFDATPEPIEILLFSLTSSILEVAAVLDRAGSLGGRSSWPRALALAGERLADGEYGFVSALVTQDALERQLPPIVRTRSTKQLPTSYLLTPPTSRHRTTPTPGAPASTRTPPSSATRTR